MVMIQIATVEFKSFLVTVFRCAVKMPVESKQWFEKIEINMKAPYQYKGGQRSHQTLNRHPPRGRHAPNYAYVTPAKRHFNGRPSAGYQASMQGPPVNVYQVRIVTSLFTE